MAWWTAVPAGLKLAGSVANAIGQYRQADLIRKYGEERVRRMRYEHERVLGETRARGAASGVEFESSSIQTYLTEMANEFRLEEDWLRKSSEAEAKAMRTAALFSGFQGLGSSVLELGKLNNWFMG